MFLIVRIVQKTSFLQKEKAICTQKIQMSQY